MQKKLCLQIEKLWLFASPGLAFFSMLITLVFESGLQLPEFDRIHFASYATLFPCLVMTAIGYIFLGSGVAKQFPDWIIILFFLSFCGIAIYIGYFFAVGTRF